MTNPYTEGDGAEIVQAARDALDVIEAQPEAAADLVRLARGLQERFVEHRTLEPVTALVSAALERAGEKLGSDRADEAAADLRHVDSAPRLVVTWEESRVSR